MVMREQLESIISSGKPWAAERAEMALAIMQQYEGGGLELAEYQELMQDLVRSDVLNAQADDQDLKNLLVSCVMIGAKLA
jgi:hypothetical protein